MVAAETAADEKVRLPKTRARDPEARAKAAAWAWYQRSAGSVGPAGVAGKSEAFASRCTARLSPSRFQREAAMRARLHLLPEDELTSSSSSASSSGLLLDKLNTSGSLSSSTSTSLNCTASFNAGTVDALDQDYLSTCYHRENSAAIDHQIPLHQDHEQPSLQIVPIDSTACWDCGSSLFDSFELVSMSKKLDAELHGPDFDGPLDALEFLASGFDFKQQKVLSLCDAPHNDDLLSPPSSPPAAPQLHSPIDIFDKLISAPSNQSKQAVYDMFCHYGDAAENASKQAPAFADASCGGEARKHKVSRHGRVLFHGIAKALNNLKHLSGGGGSGDGNEAVKDHEHHHHLHYSPHPQAAAAMAGRSMHVQGQGVPATSGAATLKGASAPDQYEYDEVVKGPPTKERHVHHHHHHHYHYLFHSDDDFRLQHLDKSLMVAAAGLRSSTKTSPTLSSYLESPARGDFPTDFGRKWAALGSIP